MFDTFCPFQNKVAQLEKELDDQRNKLERAAKTVRIIKYRLIF